MDWKGFKLREVLREFYSIYGFASFHLFWTPPVTKGRSSRKGTENGVNGTVTSNGADSPHNRKEKSS